VALEIETLPPVRPDTWTTLMDVLTLSAIVGVAMILLGQFADRLRDSLAHIEAAREALQASEARHRSVVEELDEVVFRTDAAGRWTLLNPAWTQITGRSVESSLGQPVAASIEADDRALIRAQMDGLLAGTIDRFSESARLATTEDVTRWVELRARPAFDAEGHVAGVSGTLTDVTERRRLQQQLSDLALRDPLTGLANRNLFRDRVGNAQARCRRGRRLSAVLFLDLDGFKAVNDSLGHGAGDQLLVETAARLSGALRPGDTLARIGGDEFGILLDGLVDMSDAVEVADRLVAVAREPVTVDGHRFVGSASIGIAPLDRKTTGIEEVLRNADLAMYEAKATNRGGCTIFEPAMHWAAVARVDDLDELRVALERGQLYLDYQPIVDLTTERMTGVEALLRWRHPVRGIIEPATFIPLAEESGLIVPIGAWVIHEACRQARIWLDSLPPRTNFSVGINLSPVQLADPGLVGEIAAALEESGIEPGVLLFELTETAVMANPEQAAERMAVVKLLGVRMAIDDFGTGYSSLSYVHRFPVDVLKLDRSFISGLERDQSATAMAEVFVRLGRLLNLTTVAEGIETSGEAEALRRLDCHLAQGFLFGRPTDPATIGDRLNRLAGPPRMGSGRRSTETVTELRATG
jgi:diguanylate cyclase (GGDEF)-like protein